MEDLKPNLFTSYAIGMDYNNNSDLREKIDEDVILYWENRLLDEVEKNFRRSV